MTTAGPETDAAIAAIKAEMMPQIDAALTAWATALNQVMQTASQAEIDRCISILDSCAVPDRHEWNDALAFAAERLRSWKANADA